jgi:hypothetical protein
MTRGFLLIAACAVVGCGSETEAGNMPGGGGGGMGGSGAAAPSAAFVGTYTASFNGMSTFISPPGTPPAAYTDTGTITVTAKNADTILMAWTVGNNPPSGTIEFKLGGTTDSASGTGGTPWMGRLWNGALQTSWCDVCGASLMGDRLTQTQEGHFEGITATGVPYSGTYAGTWSGTRVK